MAAPAYYFEVTPEFIARVNASEWLRAAGQALDLPTVGDRWAHTLVTYGPAQVRRQIREDTWHAVRRGAAGYPHFGAYRRLCLFARFLARSVS